jgi:Ca2+-binding EF-hand superfamily protein
MGAKQSKIPLKETFTRFNEWDHSSAELMLDAFVRLNLDVVVDEPSLALLTDEREWSSEVMNEFQASQGRIQALAFLSAVGICCAGTPADKAQFVFQVFDFDGTGTMWFQEVVILLINVVHGLVSVTGEGRRPSHQVLEYIVSSAFWTLGKTQDGFMTKAEFMRWVWEWLEISPMDDISLRQLMMKLRIIDGDDAVDTKGPTVANPDTFWEDSDIVASSDMTRSAPAKSQSLLDEERRVALREARKQFYSLDVEGAGCLRRDDILRLTQWLFTYLQRAGSPLMLKDQKRILVRLQQRLELFESQEMDFDEYSEIVFARGGRGKGGGGGGGAFLFLFGDDGKCLG